MIDAMLRDLVAEVVRTVVRDELRSALSKPADAGEGTSPLRLDEVLTVDEGAVEAKCSKKTIRAACASGALTAHKPAGCSGYRFTREALLKWLAPTLDATGGRKRSSSSDAGPALAVAKLLRGAPT